MRMASLFRNGFLKGALCLAFAFSLAASASASGVDALSAATGTAEDVQVQTHPGETVNEYAFGDIAQGSFWVDSFGPDGDGEGTCMNRGTSFRFMEALADYWEDGVLRPYDVQLEMGWAFGCSVRLYDGYNPYTWDETLEGYTYVLDDEGNRVVREGPFHMEDYFYAATLPSAMEDGSFYSIRAKILSTGDVFDLHLADSAFPDGYFDVRSQVVALAADPGLNNLNDEQQAVYDRYLELYDQVLDNLIAGGETLVVVDHATAIANKVFPFLDSQALRFQEAKDGAIETLDLEEACMEEENGATAFCLCRATAYRVAQMASGLWEDGVFRSWDVAVETGWNTDGPEGLLVGEMGVENFSYGIGGSVTAMEDLTLDDAWYRVTVLSTGESATFVARDNYLSEEFLALRSKNKKGTATAEEKAELKALKAGLVEKAKALPFTGRFYVQEGTKPLRAETVLYSDVLDYLDGSGKVASLDMATSVVEADGKICLCQSAAFRISQMMAPVWSDGLFHPEDVTIETGWNTEGPEEFWVDQLGLAAGDLTLARDATAVEDLALDDAWYRVTLKSTGESFLFRATDLYYRSNFLDLRAKNKKGTSTNAEKTRMQLIRAAMAEDILETPLVGFFVVSEDIAYVGALPVADAGGTPLLPDTTMPAGLSDAKLAEILGNGYGEIQRRLHYGLDSDRSEVVFSVDVDDENLHALLGRTASGDVAVVAEGGLAAAAAALEATLTENGRFDSDRDKAGVQANLYLISAEKGTGGSDDPVDDPATGGGSSGGCSLASGFDPALLLLALPLLLAVRKER